MTVAKAFVFAVGLCWSVAAGAQQPLHEVACSWAPSQSAVVLAATSATGGAAASLPAIASALGLTVVPHSSGAAILTGGSGYIAGTLGTAAAGPFIVTAGVVLGTGAVSLELLCSPVNHPEGISQVAAAAQAFQARVGSWVRGRSGMLEAIQVKTEAITGPAQVMYKRIFGLD